MIDLSVRTTANVLQRRHLTPLPVEEYEFFNGSAQTTEQLEDCGEGEELDVCMNRIDRMNFRYHVKSWLEKVRDRVGLPSLLGKPVGKAVGKAVGETVGETLGRMKNIARRGDGRDGDEDGLGGEEDGWGGDERNEEEKRMVERVVKTVQQSKDREEPKEDDPLERFRGLMRDIDIFKGLEEGEEVDGKEDGDVGNVGEEGKRLGRGDQNEAEEDEEGRAKRMTETIES